MAITLDHATKWQTVWIKVFMLRFKKGVEKGKKNN